MDEAVLRIVLEEGEEGTQPKPPTAPTTSPLQQQPASTLQTSTTPPAPPKSAPIPVEVIKPPKPDPPPAAPPAPPKFDFAAWDKPNKAIVPPLPPIDTSGPGKITSDLDQITQSLGMGQAVKEVPTTLPLQQERKFLGRDDNPADIMAAKMAKERRQLTEGWVPTTTKGDTEPPEKPPDPVVIAEAATKALVEIPEKVTEPAVKPQITPMASTEGVADILNRLDAEKDKPRTPMQPVVTAEVAPTITPPPVVAEVVTPDKQLSPGQAAWEALEKKEEVGAYERPEPPPKKEPSKSTFDSVLDLASSLRGTLGGTFGRTVGAGLDIAAKYKDMKENAAGGGEGAGGLAGIAGAAAGPVALGVMAAEAVKGAIKGGIQGIGNIAKGISSPDETPARGIEAIGGAISKVGELAPPLLVVGEGLKVVAGLMDNFNKMADKYRQYNPAIAQAQAQAEIKEIMGDMRRAQQSAPELAKFIKEQAVVQQKFEDIKIKIWMKILPVVTRILEHIEWFIGKSETDFNVEDPIAVILNQAEVEKVRKGAHFELNKDRDAIVRPDAGL